VGTALFSSKYRYVEGSEIIIRTGTGAVSGEKKLYRWSSCAPAEKPEMVIISKLGKTPVEKAERRVSRQSKAVMYRAGSGELSPPEIQRVFHNRLLKPRADPGFLCKVSDFFGAEWTSTIPGAFFDRIFLGITSPNPLSEVQYSEVTDSSPNHGATTIVFGSWAAFIPRQK
jgi:hypothetical protein